MRGEYRVHPIVARQMHERRGSWLVARPSRLPAELLLEMCAHVLDDRCPTCPSALPIAPSTAPSICEPCWAGDPAAATPSKCVEPSMLAADVPLAAVPSSLFEPGICCGSEGTATAAGTPAGSGSMALGIVVMATEVLASWASIFLCCLVNAPHTSLLRGSSGGGNCSGHSTSRTTRSWYECQSSSTRNSVERRSTPMPAARASCVPLKRGMRAVDRKPKAKPWDGP